MWLASCQVEVSRSRFSHLWVGKSFWKHLAGKGAAKERAHSLAPGGRERLWRDGGLITSPWTCCPRPGAVALWEGLVSSTLTWEQVGPEDRQAKEGPGGGRVRTGGQRGAQGLTLCRF